MGRYSRLAETERKKIRQHLGSRILSLEAWLARLERSDCEILCLGEFHEESTRRFLSASFFDRFRLDVLLVEATPKALNRLMKKMAAGRTYFPLQGADMLAVLRTVQRRNPESRICGIEETPGQEQENKGKGGSRDRSLASNFWSCYRPGMRHVILIGSLHCTNDPGWLFGRLLGEAPSGLRQRMTSVKLVGKSRSGPLQGFLLFLDRIGIATKHKAFVFSGTGTLHPRLLRWFPALRSQGLGKYQALIVFR
jgi:hypothetical protein